MKCQESLESRKLKNEYQLRTNSGKSGLSRPKQTKNFSLMTGTGLGILTVRRLAKKGDSSVKVRLHGQVC